MQVSRLHVALTRTGDPASWRQVRWTAVDLGSRAGTFVNRIRLGTVSWKFSDLFRKSIELLCISLL